MNRKEERELDQVIKERDYWEGKATRLLAAADGLLSRKKEGPSEDAHIFGEWDDLEDAIADND